jgi:hypothetical protein
MPGLISSTRYEEAKKRLCLENVGAEATIDAIEWRLLDVTALDEFPIVPEVSKPADKPPIRSIVVDATPHTAGIVAVFTTETHAGDEKILLLDAWLVEDDED